MPSTIVERYKRILSGAQKRFSPYEFEDMQYRKQKVQLVIRYAIEQVKMWTPEQARREMSIKDVKELKLHLIREYVEPPIEAKAQDVYYLVEYAYPYLPKPSEEQKILWVYEEVLAGIRRHFPPLYFQSVKGEERAKICFDYMCNKLMNIKDLRELPRIFGKTEQAYHYLRKYKLKILVDTLYFSPFDMITDMYPELADPRLWEDG
ncbi:MULTISPECIES: hypothetical protein [Brevibacillus]|uniref:DUF4046 domain-containing protein n=2 Tax=Brevibacillus borstelensis TaxID=45462 RepID=M8E6R9_9BACL|nr:hypothetical protein [Brevibacillus borstelensis]EMT51125.1 hypothetical protein I532_19452 [Brevibacillus borstelensis AK1]KKX52836.1 hypothetical protein X546_23320 [Brevibacillus borstelensis cifa_chp40]MBE5394483.1 hypothetical protein [Brevibacillus borstelensis]MCC0566074.1 hypothetical protein [Brevibacillus borstelensis]MCM3472718.1 hypothetical protein [Brevibacillus borstelensis]